MWLLGFMNEVEVMNVVMKVHEWGEVHSVT